MRTVLLVVIVLVVLLPVLFIYGRSATPTIELTSSAAVIGQATPISVHVKDKNGVKRIAAYIEQNGTRYNAAEDTEASDRADRNWSFNTGVKSVPQLKDGKAQLIVEAKSNDTLGRTAKAAA